MFCSFCGQCSLLLLYCLTERNPPLLVLVIRGSRPYRGFHFGARCGRATPVAVSATPRYRHSHHRGCLLCGFCHEVGDLMLQSATVYCIYLVKSGRFIAETVIARGLLGPPRKLILRDFPRSVLSCPAHHLCCNHVGPGY